MEVTVGEIYSALQRARAKQDGANRNGDGAEAAAIAEVHLERVLQNCELIVTVSESDKTVCDSLLLPSS